MTSSTTTASAWPSLPKLMHPLLLYLLLSNPQNVASFPSGRFYHSRVRSYSFSASSPSTEQQTNTRPRNANAGTLHAKSKGGNEGDFVALIHSHHLLDHKPDNMILSGKKFKLRGAACLGRPGAALCIGPRKNFEKFVGKLRGAMPQKKFGTVEITSVEGRVANGDDEDGGGSSSSSASAVTVLDGLVDGFEQASVGEMRDLMGAVGREDQFLALIGIDNSSKSRSPSQSKPVENAGDLENSKSGGKKKKKNRKKRG